MWPNSPANPKPQALERPTSTSAKHTTLPPAPSNLRPTTAQASQLIRPDAKARCHHPHKALLYRTKPASAQSTRDKEHAASFTRQVVRGQITPLRGLTQCSHAPSPAPFPGANRPASRQSEHSRAVTTVSYDQLWPATVSYAGVRSQANLRFPATSIC